MWQAMAAQGVAAFGKGLGESVGGGGPQSADSGGNSFGGSPFNASGWSVATGGSRGGSASATSNDPIGSVGAALGSPYTIAALAIVGVAAYLLLRKR